MKKIVIISDVLTSGQVNGVGTWIINTKKELEKKEHKVIIVDATYFSHTFPLPSYPEIRLVLTLKKTVENLLRDLKPDVLHIATEGTLGLLARQVCTTNNWQFTSSYHTRFPEYIYVRTKLRILENAVYTYIRWFHSKSTHVVVTTEQLRIELEEKKIQHLTVVPLGVDIDLFRRNKLAPNSTLEKPIFVYLGRIAPEKNVEAFLNCKLPGSKLIIGDGPARNELEKKYKDTAHFVGYKKGQELVDLLSISNVAVFSSKTDTFGLTIIEALACGLPVAAYNVQGPNSIITEGKDGFLGDNLEENSIKCLSLKQEDCVEKARLYSWKHATARFLNILVPSKFS
jgi:glycosyltransferase involved in cell wall biosynthesis